MYLTFDSSGVDLKTKIDFEVGPNQVTRPLANISLILDILFD